MGSKQESTIITKVVNLRGDTLIKTEGGHDFDPNFVHLNRTACIIPGQEVIAHHLDGETLNTPLLILGNRSFETSVPIVPESACQGAVEALKTQFSHYFDPDQVCIIPIKRGGSVIGEALAETGVIQIPMQMTNYDNDEKLPSPVCLEMPNVEQIVNPDGSVKKVVLAEAVVETQGTIEEAIRIIESQIASLRGTNGYPSNLPCPEIYIFTLVSKISQETRIRIPNLTAALWVHPDVWVFGWGCDSNQEGREALYIGGQVSPDARTLPPIPYWQPLLSF